MMFDFDLRSIIQTIFIVVAMMLIFILGRYTTLEEIKLASKVMCENPYFEINETTIIIKDKPENPVQLNISEFIKNSSV